MVKVLSFLGLSLSSAFWVYPRRRTRGNISTIRLASDGLVAEGSNHLVFKCGLLFSSFQDGLRSNWDAQDYLRRGLIQSLLLQEQQQLERCLAESAVQSPCCGPNTRLLDQLDAVDEKLRRVWSHTYPLELLCNDEYRTTSISDPMSTALENTIRLVYIPTALYALRPESNNTPGKQRQRARADGKTRRDNLVQFLWQDILLGTANVAAVTVDLDDDSVKQPQHIATAAAAAAAAFPQDGKQALVEWCPNLIYVEGGNTFWLHHCMEKGSYREILVQTLSSRNSSTVFCGSSAGAILVGSQLETACWKGWDNPAVVSGMELYQDWKGVAGLDLAGGHSFFPHMDESWNTLVDDKTATGSSVTKHNLVCLEEDQVFCLGQHHKHEPLLFSSNTMSLEKVHS